MHMPRFNLWRQVLAGSVLLFLLSGCGAIDYFFLSPPQDTARELAEAGTQAMEDQKYKQAAKAFETLKDRYPFSPFATTAELGLADAYFLDEKYSAAVTAYKEFEAIHPGHEAIPYVLFRIGMASYEQFTSIDRPQDNIREAIQYFRRVSDSFPDSEYATLADDYIKKCRRLIAEHEIYVADFYWRTENYGAAWKRYQYIIDNFPDLPDILDYAIGRSQVAYYFHLRNQSEEDRRDLRGHWSRFFNWL